MPFVDRSDQLTVLEEALDDAERGQGGVVLVAGGLASGKTELLKRFGTYADAKGFTVLTAFGARAERALPLELAGQLFHAGALPPDLVARACPVLRTEPDADDTLSPEARTLVTLLLELADRNGPLVISVDDVHFTDAASAQVLLYLSRRLVRSRVLLLLTEPARPPAHHLPFRAQLTRLPHEILALPPLSPEGIAQVLGGAIPAVAAHAQTVTGGNPALVQGLARDNPDAGPGDPRVPGAAYRQAVLACLHRCEPEVLEVARAVALLGGHTDTELTAAVAAVPAALVEPGLRALADAGLLEQGRFRHEQGAAAVVEGVPEPERARVRLRAAHVLHARGAGSAEVGRYLLAAGSAPGHWAAVVLRQVAQEALADDDVEQAVTAAQLALAQATDEHLRLGLVQQIAQALWRGSPAAAASRMEPLWQALRERRLASEHGHMLVRCMLWHGLFGKHLHLIRANWPAADPRVLETNVMNAGIAAIDLGLGYLWIYGPREDNPFIDFARKVSDRDGGSWLESVMTTAPAFFREPRDSGLGHCDVAGLPETFVLGDTTLEGIACAVTALLHTDQIEQADRWCTALVAEAEKRAAPTWQAVLGALHADVLLRKGELERAAHLAESALRLLSPPSWGLIITLPLTVLFTANTALGRHGHNEQLLHRYPVPQDAGDTLLGLRYLRARGHHRLAGDDTLKALADFDRCRVQARSAGIDLPELLPWRTDIAQVRLRLGEREQARQLAEEELELARSPRSRGIATRTAAACAVARARPALLHTAIDLLQESADQLELARATVQLGRAYEDLGDFSRARILVQSADHHARLLHLPPTTPAPAAPAALLAVRPGAGAEPSVLSDAELRVARLAARGHTNREISRRLSITISTVEQHITRIYRKLDIKTRADLPDRLFATFCESTGTA